MLVVLVADDFVDVLLLNEAAVFDVLAPFGVGRFALCHFGTREQNLLHISEYQLQSLQIRLSTALSFVCYFYKLGNKLK